MKRKIAIVLAVIVLCISLIHAHGNEQEEPTYKETPQMIPPLYETPPRNPTADTLTFILAMVFPFIIAFLVFLHRTKQYEKAQAARKSK